MVNKFDTQFLIEGSNLDEDDIRAGIIVAWLAKFNTFYMMLISFLLIFLDRGASEIASAYSLNEYAADIITGIILFFILGSEFFINYRLVWRGHHDGKEGK